ncbi:phosphatidylinositol-4-phosphate 5 kinase-like protein [Phytophthora sojae]|uniref:Phosphatidylinositol-4-phosphate 5 kinase-like protein n=1 Tax=Phytophthora sojae (strain P6497) TaxID=1094619 RepID=G4YE74_PHYSP|nr:phosphatidylinositol-4-phosphate 5 kinase-like protein [Phytophthora sojae]EGZ26781.1 phosphatidylinositol-4-phosphate 5 kinase-like protein [Phytophthora sojae]|eukprot:XP_009514056.1 phosphatidylinositol-4-phosphate 5 kinase-like protein [Phytophthora sojae]
MHLDDEPPQYQAVSTPTRSSHEDAGVARTRSHSHALSAILGANGRVSASASVANSVDWRPSSQQQLQVAAGSNSQLQLPAPELAESKTELPVRLARWRKKRRRWRRILFWLGSVSVFFSCFAVTFAAPQQTQRLAPTVLGAGLSLLTTLLVLVSFLRRRRLRRRPNELLAYVALSEFGLAMLTLTHTLTMCSTEDGTCRPMGMATCSVAAGLEMFLLLAGVGWFGAAILHLFVSVSNPFASYKRQLVLYHLVVWGFSLVASVATPFAVFSQHVQDEFQLTQAEVCRAVALILPMLPTDANQTITLRTERLAQWQELNLEFWGVLVAIVVFVVVSAQLCLVVGWWRSNSGTIIAFKARRRLMKRMTIYVHALNATWLVLLVVFFIYRSNASALAYVQVEGVEQQTSKGMNFLDAFFHFVLTAKGFVAGVVWLSVNKPCCVLGLVFCGIHQCKENDDDGPSLGASVSASASSQSASLSGSSNGDAGVPRANNVALLSATVMSMEAGILAPQDMPMMSPTSTVLAFEAHESVRESAAVRPQERQSLAPLSSVMGPPSTARSSRSSSSSYDASTVESYEASQNNETLQREIIYYTVCGITKAIIRAAERARASSITTDNANTVLGEDGVANSAVRNRDGGLVETTLFVGAERDSTLVNSTFISHVQSVTILSSPRAYCEPRTQLPVVALHRSLVGVDDAELRGGDRVQQHPRPTSFTGASSLDLSGNWRQPLELQHSRSQGSQSPRSSRTSLTASNILFRSFHQTPGRFSLYPVSQVPFELFEQEIELQSTRSSVDTEQPVEGKSTRSAVFAGLRRTASSAFSQGRGVFRNRSGSTEATGAGTPSTGSAIGREFLPDDPKPKVFVDYAPREFRAIRLAFGLSDEKYLASFRTTAKERVSSGSSGAFMFFSGDNSLLVKSLKEKECRALVDMAPQYARYLTANPHSRLIRFFGCHRVRLYGRNFYFAVMSNVLHSEQHTATITEKYDVKGSWVDRRARRPQRGDRVTCAECDATYIFGGTNEDVMSDAAVDTGDGRTSALDGTVPQFPFHVHRPDIVFKDLDLARSLHLPRDVAAHLNKQLVSDCEFLRDVGIMDYSLLIGIHKCHLRAPRPGGFGTASDFDEAFDREVNLEDPNSGVNLSPLGDDEVYFVGIIDILQQWDWEKQLEKAGKVLLGKSARGISAVAPAPYCRRFQARCTQILLGGPAPEDLDLDWEVDPNAASVREKETKSRPNSKKIKEMAMANLIDDKA